MEIPHFRLVPEPATFEAAEQGGFASAAPGVGSRHRLGGQSSMLATTDYPRCSDGETMTFYGQLDSISDEICLADAGVIAVFVCFECFETQAILCST